MGDPGVAPFGLLMVHGRGSGMSRDLPVAAPWSHPEIIFTTHVRVW